MDVKSAIFVASYGKQSQIPQDKRAEIAFIGRSNVGKSSLINMLCEKKDLAKTSGKPGKTQSINRFLINDTWYLIDLPGYGYAQVSKKKREIFSDMIADYLLQSKQLKVVCVLVDGRIKPQAIDIEFVHWCGSNDIPFCIFFTKTEKMKENERLMLPELYKAALHQAGFDEFPDMILTSATSKAGRKEVLAYFKEVVLN